MLPILPLGITVFNGTVTDANNDSIVIGAFSTIGFALLIGVPTVLATAAQILADTKNIDYDRPHLRLIVQLSKTKWTGFFYLMAAFFLASGILDVGYLMLSYYFLLNLSLVVLLTTLGFTVASLLYLLIDITYLFPRQRRIIGEFLNDGHYRRPRRRRTFRCDICRRRGARAEFRTQRELIAHYDDSHPAPITAN